MIESIKNPMDEYKKSVEFMAQNKKDFLFGNSSGSHAAIVMSTMLKYAENEIKMYLNNLDGSILNSNESTFCEELDLFIIEKRGVLDILVENNQTQKSGIYSKLNELSIKFPNQLKVKTDTQDKAFKSKAISLFKDNPKEVFFMVADKKSYRLEIDNTEHKAFCNFNDEKRAEKLNSVFQSSFESCPNFFN